VDRFETETVRVGQEEDKGREEDIGRRRTLEGEVVPVEEQYDDDDVRSARGYVSSVREQYRIKRTT
jgi:hypothetical protein